MRESLLTHIDSDIICVNETYLQGDASLDLENFDFYGHNRHSTHIHAPKGSGGVGIFVKNDIILQFNVSVFMVLDKYYDGILGISLISNETDYSIAIFSTYLPPQTSTRGRDATGFYTFIRRNIYAK